MLPSCTLLLELFGREAGADLLLKRQPADARVLDAVHRHAVDALARGRQRDRQRIHHETWIDAGAEHGDLLSSPTRQSAGPDGRACSPGTRALRSSDDRHLRLEIASICGITGLIDELVQSTTMWASAT